MGTDIAANIAAVKQRIAAAAERGKRSPDSVKLLAVTKRSPFRSSKKRSGQA
jgi:uncharacterized pyridoxal phosphate-containing UPF0001 family protein